MLLEDTFTTESFAEAEIPIQLLPGQVDPRLQNLSYSSLLTFHSCPRKYQLSKLNSIGEDNESATDKVTFAYGHVVGLGVQLVLQEIPWNSILWELFQMWNPPLMAEDTRQNKSFWLAVFAVQKFQTMFLEQGYLRDYELVYHNDEPAVELSFLIRLPNGFKYRGFVDAVLEHKVSGEVLVLEQKTTSRAATNSAVYKNSAQAIGYSIVLDDLFPELSSYSVLYQEYSSKTYQYEQFLFQKSYVQRARWIQELLLDVEVLQLYDSQNLYPMRGESCFTYYRECKYLGICQMETERLTKPLTQKMVDEVERDNADRYQIQVGIEDLIRTQLKKVGE